MQALWKPGRDQGAQLQLQQNTEAARGFSVKTKLPVSTVHCQKYRRNTLTAKRVEFFWHRNYL